ncbi:DUF4132 domain-containing protein [Actinocorallia libanotica]|uniref:DUF4132 domain-containing protein n=1 Tax=Actinocorallia libanotica TaxID=46162 RepID=A0ABN1RJG3_9ACTN
MSGNEPFQVPEGWLRSFKPRRGGRLRAGTAPVAVPAGGLPRPADEVLEALSRPSTPEADALRARLAGKDDPLGAAVLAVALGHAIDPAVCVEAWIRGHGIAFAAEAVVAAAPLSLHAERQWIPERGPGPDMSWSIRNQPSELPLTRTVHRLAREERIVQARMADHLRAVFAGCGEETYAQGVEALRPLRDRDAFTRFLASYLMPGESAWVDECCRADEIPWSMEQILWLSVGTAGQIETLLDRRVPLLPSDELWGTLYDAVGLEIVRVIAHGLNRRNLGIQTHLLELLALIPADAAFARLVAHLDHAAAVPFVQAAAGRFPARAARLLHEAASTEGRVARTARQMLRTHLRAHPDAAGEIPLDSPAAVPEAPVESVPEPLVTPPWKREPRPQRVVEISPPSGAHAVWVDGEREVWASAEKYQRYLYGADWPEKVSRILDYVPSAPGAKRSEHDVYTVFAHAPEELVQNRLETWRPDRIGSHDGGALMKPIAARFGTAALTPVLRLAQRMPAAAGGLLVPFRDLRVARLMATWAVRTASAHGTVAAWTARHGLVAALLILPDALAAHADRRTAAQALLRMMREETVLLAAQEHGGEVEAEIRALLGEPPADRVPARLPVLPSWTDPALLPPVPLRDGAGALPATAVRNLLLLLALSEPDRPHPVLPSVLEPLDRTALAEFGWWLFEAWRAAGQPAEQKWILAGLGHIGDDETIRRLTPLIRAWPGEGGHTRAVAGLDVLAGIGTQAAFTHLNGIAQRARYKALRRQAADRIEDLAAGLKLTAEQLADRLVPAFGLDDPAGRTFDYGPRRFTLALDAELRPLVTGPDGKPRKALPAPAASDDADLAAAARKEFSAVKRELRSVATDLAVRLEAAMVSQRSWTGAEFRLLFADHPVTVQAARRLVWTCPTGRFRIAADGSFTGTDGKDAGVPDDSAVRLLHPALAGDALPVWRALFARERIGQPFPQLDRPVHVLTPAELNAPSLADQEHRTVPTVALMGLARRGWQRGVPLEGGVEHGFSRPLPSGRHLVITLEPGIAAGAPEAHSRQTFAEIRIYPHPDGAWRGTAPAPRLSPDLDPVTVSEILADLRSLPDE